MATSKLVFGKDCNLCLDVILDFAFCYVLKFAEIATGGNPEAQMKSVMLASKKNHAAGLVEEPGAARRADDEGDGPEVQDPVQHGRVHVEEGPGAVRDARVGHPH